MDRGEHESEVDNVPSIAILILEHDENDPPCYALDFLTEFCNNYNDRMQAGSGASMLPVVRVVYYQLWREGGRSLLPTNVKNQRIMADGTQPIGLASDSCEGSQAMKVGAILSCGGDLSANDEEKHKYFRDVKRLFSSAIEHQIPVFAICLGCQLLVQALGGSVVPMHTAELGWSDLALDSNLCTPSPTEVSSMLKPWFSDEAKQKDTVRFFQFHSDTWTLPSGCHLLASSSVCRNQAFQFRDQYVIGTQFHCESDAAKAKVWAEYGHPGFQMNPHDHIVPQKVILDTADEEAAHSCKEMHHMLTTWVQGIALPKVPKRSG